jgi:hypothetical protein
MAQRLIRRPFAEFLGLTSIFLGTFLKIAEKGPCLKLIFVGLSTGAGFDA